MWSTLTLFVFIFILWVVLYFLAGPRVLQTLTVGPTGPTGMIDSLTGPTGPTVLHTGPTGAHSTMTGPPGPDSNVTGPTGAGSSVTGPTGATSTLTGPTGMTGEAGDPYQINLITGLQVDCMPYTGIVATGNVYIALITTDVHVGNCLCLSDINGNPVDISGDDLSGHLISYDFAATGASCWIDLGLFGNANITGPTGPMGQPGPDGPTGPSGTVGVSITGPSGSSWTGVTGPSGTNNFNNFSGPTGSVQTGPTGPNFPLLQDDSLFINMRGAQSTPVNTTVNVNFAGVLTVTTPDLITSPNSTWQWDGATAFTCGLTGTPTGIYKLCYRIPAIDDAGIDSVSSRMLLNAGTTGITGTTMYQSWRSAGIGTFYALETFYASFRQGDVIKIQVNIAGGGGNPRIQDMSATSLTYSTSGGPSLSIVRIG